MNRTRSSFFLFTVMFLLAVYPKVAFAQGSNASISGIVQDPSKALVPGVTLTVTNQETGVTLTTVTNEAGAYGFPSIAPGKYTISAALPGFRTSTLKDLDVGRTQLR